MDLKRSADVNCYLFRPGQTYKASGCAYLLQTAVMISIFIPKCNSAHRCLPSSFNAFFSMIFLVVVIVFSHEKPFVFCFLCVFLFNFCFFLCFIILACFCYRSFFVGILFSACSISRFGFLYLIRASSLKFYSLSSSSIFLYPRTTLAVAWY